MLQCRCAARAGARLVRQSHSASAELRRQLDSGSSHLDLRFADFGEATSAAALGDALAGGAIKGVDLRHNEVGDEGAARLVRALRRGRALEWVDLRANGLGDRGVSLVGGLLFGAEAPPLRALNLWNNGVSPEGVRRLATCLHKNRRLESLNLGNNATEDEGAVELSDALAQHPAIADLGLRNCYVDDRGVIEGIAPLVRASPTLRRLNLRNNCVSDLGFCSLIEAILSRDGPRFELLDLQGNEVTSAGVALVREHTADKAHLLPEQILLHKQLGVKGSPVSLVYRAGEGWSEPQRAGAPEAGPLAESDPYGWEAR